MPIKPSEACKGNVTADGKGEGATPDAAVEQSIDRARSNGEKACKKKKCDGNGKLCTYNESSITVGDAEEIPGTNPTRYRAKSTSTGACDCE